MFEFLNNKEKQRTLTTNHTNLHEKYFFLCVVRGKKILKVTFRKPLNLKLISYSTVTDFARFLGLSMALPLKCAK